LFDGATTLIDRSLARADALNLTGITDNVSPPPGGSSRSSSNSPSTIAKDTNSKNP
jgi:hypothetical protein